MMTTKTSMASLTKRECAASWNNCLILVTMAPNAFIWLMLSSKQMLLLLENYSPLGSCNPIPPFLLDPVTWHGTKWHWWSLNTENCWDKYLSGTILLAAGTSPYKTGQVIWFICSLTYLPLTPSEQFTDQKQAYFGMKSFHILIYTLWKSTTVQNLHYNVEPSVKFLSALLLHLLQHNNCKYHMCVSITVFHAPDSPVLTTVFWGHFRFLATYWLSSSLWSSAQFTSCPSSI